MKKKDKDLNFIIEELSFSCSSIIYEYLDFLSSLNESNPILANYLLEEFGLHMNLLKHMLKLYKKED